MKKIFSLIILILLTVSCTNKDVNESVKTKQDNLKNVKLLKKETKKEFNPSLINGSDILTIFLSYKKYSQYEQMVNMCLIENGKEFYDIKNYCKSIKSFPRIGENKDKTFKMVKWDKINDSTYECIYNFKEFYRESINKKILVNYDQKTEKAKIILDKNKISFNDMSAVLRNE
jgi:hypothetical protein